MHKRTFLLAAASAAMTLALPALAQGTAPAAPLTLTGTGLDGKPLALTDFAGKVVLASFFSAGCNLCVNELKLMREFYGANRQRDFVLLGVNLDDKPDDVRQYVELLNLTVTPQQRFPIAWRHAPQHRDSFGAITRRPTHFVLDRQHRPLLRREGNFLPADWDDLWLSLA